MSILNLVVTKGRALIAVDTATTRLEGPRGDASKLLSIPHANLLIAGRGRLDVLVGFYAASAAVSDPTLDNFSRDGPDRFQEILQLVDMTYQQKGVQWDRSFGDSVVIAGWSDTAERMKVVSITHDPNNEAEPLTVRREGDWFNVRPGNCFGDGLPVPQSAEDMMPLARAQLHWMREAHGEWATGGSLIVAEMTRHTTLIRDLGVI